MRMELHDDELFRYLAIKKAKARKYLDPMTPKPTRHHGDWPHAPCEICQKEEIIEKGCWWGCLPMVQGDLG